MKYFLNSFVKLTYIIGNFKFKQSNLTQSIRMQRTDFQDSLFIIAINCFFHNIKHIYFLLCLAKRIFFHIKKKIVLF